MGLCSRWRSPSDGILSGGMFLALRDVEHAVVAQEGHGFFACWLLRGFHVQPFPEHHGAGPLALFDVSAQFLGLVERQPKRGLVHHGVKQEDVHTPILSLAGKVPWHNVAALPGFLPGDHSFFQQTDDSVRYDLPGVYLHAYPFLARPGCNRVSLVELILASDVRALLWQGLPHKAEHDAASLFSIAPGATPAAAQTDSRNLLAGGDRPGGVGGGEGKKGAGLLCDTPSQDRFNFPGIRALFTFPTLFTHGWA